MDLYITYSQTREGGDICEGQENDPYPSHEDEYIETSFRSALRKQPEGYRLRYETVDVPAEVFQSSEVFLAVGFYTDGDTFRRTYGNVHIIGVFRTHEEASAAVNEAVQKSDLTVPWNGHFSRFEREDIVPLRVHSR